MTRTLRTIAEIVTTQPVSHSSHLPQILRRYDCLDSSIPFFVTNLAVMGRAFGWGSRLKDEAFCSYMTFGGGPASTFRPVFYFVCFFPGRCKGFIQ